MHFIKKDFSLAPAYATRYVFLVLGLAISVWAVLVPFAKMRMALDTAVLGALLLLIGGGALVSMPIAGYLTTRFGCRTVLLCSLVLFLLSIIVLSFVSHIAWFGCALFLFGVSSGIVDVAMNIQALLIEKIHKKSMMSGFHSMYSVGGCIGAVIISFLLKSGLSEFTATALFLGILLLIFLLFFVRHLFAYGNTQKNDEKKVMPKGIVLLMGALCFILYMCDGIVLDWGALYMQTNQSVQAQSAGLVFSVYSVAITVARLCGDKLCERFGMRKVMLVSALTAFVGCVLILLSSGGIWPFLSFVILGLGAANLIPLLFTVAARQKVMPANSAISCVTTLGYLGMLIGPPIMGFVAHHSGLPMIFAIVATLFVVVAVACEKLHSESF